MYKLSLLASLVISAANAEECQSHVHFGEDEHYDYNKYHTDLLSTSQDLFLGFGKKKKEVDPVVQRFANGSIDWGTPGNRPLEKPVEYYQTFEQIVTENGFFYEAYEAITADGYMLDVYRIKSKDTEDGAPVVFF